MRQTAETFRWVEVKPKPKKAGLHDSGYRFLQVVGVTVDGKRVDLGEWHDVVHFGMTEPASIDLDVTEDGAWRFFSLRGDLQADGIDLSSLCLEVVRRSKRDDSEARA